MLFALILMAVGLLLVAAAPRRGRCDHRFVPADSLDYGTHRELLYRCEKCGVALEGQV